MSFPNHDGSRLNGRPIKDIEGHRVLSELALNLRWSWNHATDDVWRQLDPDLWEITHNPWVVLQTASCDRIDTLLAGAEFRATIEALKRARSHNLSVPGWFQQNHPGTTLTQVAYFSMEFMLSEALPIYSGGLGNVAGDQLKAASDLGVPVVGIGLLYQQGYFRQVIDKSARQQALYPYNDPGQLPITPVRLDNGEWLRLEFEVPGSPIRVRVWQVDVGRAKLYLLDTNDGANYPAHRGITSELYGGGLDLRFQQELLLGIGGWRVMEALGIQPEVCHLNEGHAAFAILERARSFMKSSGQPFEVALEITRAGNLFTTHTAVPAGFDRYPPELVEHYLGRYAEDLLGISCHDLLAMGRMNPENSSEPFNMAYFAIRGSGAVNGVSRLHESVSKQIFQPLFPHWPQAEVPVGHVTNGVHMPTWDSASADHLWTEECSSERWLGKTDTLEQDMEKASDAKVWQMRTETTKTLVEFARRRLSRDLASSGAFSDAVEFARTMFDPCALTLGFARRFATYKRPNLLLHDRARLLRLLSDPNRPVQLIIAGKAHPEDLAGQELISEWIKFIRLPEVRPHIAFLSDYDMFLSEQLVQGVDVWINTPMRPWEASGTSGMKVLVNGGINLSELDGWWAEAYTPEVGWALGDGKEHGDDPAWDAFEANQLYTLLEEQVIPEFYNRDENGIPRAWVARMRASISQLTPRFSADRSIREYTENYYLPASAAYTRRQANQATRARIIVDWRHSLDEKWHLLHFGDLYIHAQDEDRMFEVELFLDNLDPLAIKVELYADGVCGNPSTKLAMNLVRKPDGVSHYHVYGATVSSARPVSDFTARVIPHFEGVSLPLEESRILWRS
jgi:starch phosphorylase